MKITALVHTRNEEKNLPGCLESLRWVDQVVVADMASTDRTCEIASGYGAVVLQVPLGKVVEEVRNKAIQQCTGDWIVLVDADERVSPGLARVLQEEATRLPQEIGACYVPRRNYFLGEWLEHGFWPDYQVRFLRQGRVIWPEEVHAFPQVDGKIHKLPVVAEAALEHPGMAAELGSFLEKLVKYSALEARTLSATFTTPIWPYLLRRPLGEFYGRYFQNGAWRHGMHGLVWSLSMGLYQLMIAMHLWDLQKNRPQPAAAKLKQSVRMEALRSMKKWLLP